MSVHEHLKAFYGLPVHELGEDPGADLPEPDSVAWRISGDGYDMGDSTVTTSLAGLLERVDASRIRAIVVGWWGAGWEGERSDVPIAALAEAQLPALEAIFLGDIVSEESEISWIEHGDITPLLEAYPQLRRLEVRGGTGLTMRPVSHDELRVLRFETGGLPAGVVRAVGASTLPALEHLELWLGEEQYSGDSRTDDWSGILAGTGLPALRHLGLQDSEVQDEVAAAVAAAPVVARLESLDLSMGALTDEGAEALLSGQPLTHLKRLNLRYHYLSEAMVERVAAALPGVEVDLTDQQEPDDDWRFVEVSE